MSTIGAAAGGLDRQTGIALVLLGDPVRGACNRLPALAFARGGDSQLFVELVG